MKLGLREANQKFSKLVRAVRAGQEVVLTDRGEAIAVVKPLEHRGRERAFQAMVTEGLIRSARQQFAKDRAQWNLLAVSTEILERAEQLVASHTVRTLDAIHIASAQEFAGRLQAHLPFISADQRQIEAAAAAGLMVQQVG